MAQVFHKRATTKLAIRAKIQRSTESTAALSRRYGISPKTVRKWHTVEDTRMGHPGPSFYAADAPEGAAAVTFRQKTLAMTVFTRFSERSLR